MRRIAEWAKKAPNGNIKKGDTAMGVTADEEVGYAEFRTSNDALGDGDELLRRLEQESYLFFRGLLPGDAVLQARRDTLELCEAEGWLKPGADLMDGIVADGMQPLREGQPPYMVVYKKMLRLPSFSELPRHPALLDLAGKLLQGSVLVHPRRIGRITFPHNLRATTPPHQDFFYIRGSARTYTMWMPLGDCPVQLGGLAVLQGSHRAGFIEHTVRSEGAVGGVGVDPDRDLAGMACDWRCGDFGVGDVLLFHSHTVHKAMPNLTADRLRLSTDNRYQRAEDDIHPSSLGSHFDL